MKKKMEAHATVSEWTDDNGKKCKRTVQVGTIFESANGRLVMKLECLPTSKDWSGWIAFRPCVSVLPPMRRVSPGMPDAPAQTDEEDEEDEEDEDEPPF